MYKSYFLRVATPIFLICVSAYGNPQYKQEHPATPSSTDLSKTVSHPEYGKIISNEVVIIVKAGTSVERVEQIAKQVGMSITGKLEEINGWKLQFEGKKSGVRAVSEAIKKLKKIKEIEVASPNTVGSLA